MPKEGTATIQNNTAKKITQFIWIVVGGQYGGSIITYTSANQIYNVAHIMYKRIIEDFYEENPQKEVLQQCIKLQKGLTMLF